MLILIILLILLLGGGGGYYGHRRWGYGGGAGIGLGTVLLIILSSIFWVVFTISVRNLGCSSRKPAQNAAAPVNDFDRQALLRQGRDFRSHTGRGHSVAKPTRFSEQHTVDANQ